MSQEVGPPTPPVSGESDGSETDEIKSESNTDEHSGSDDSSSSITFDEDMHFLDPATVLTESDGPFSKMPEELKALHPDWTTLDVGNITVVLDNVFISPENDPFRKKLVMRLVRCYEDFERAECTRVSFQDLRTTRFYVPVTHSQDFIIHSDLKWLKKLNGSAVLIYHTKIPKTFNNP